LSAAPSPLAVTSPLASPAWPQRAAARLVGSKLFWTLFVAAGFTLPLVRSILRPLPVPPPFLASMPAFSATDEAGKPLTNAVLAGRIVILEFASVDEVRAGSPFARLQTRVRNTGNAVHLVTFLKGATDTASLTALAKDAHAGTWRWSFATGHGDALEVELAQRLHVPSLEGKIVLVDPRGRIRHLASPTKDEIDTIMREIGLLANLPDLLPQENRSR
jgi:hypothetical protein